MTDTIEAIVEAIRSAFAGVPRGAITLHEAEVIDSYGDDDARARARRRDTEASWMEIPGTSTATPNMSASRDWPVLKRPSLAGFEPFSEG